MADIAIREVDGGVVFRTKVVPGSSRTIFCGPLDGMLKIKVAAAAEKGKANACLLQFLAEKLGVKKNTLSIISGTTTPVKSVKVSGISRREFLEKLGFDKQR